MGVGLAGFLEAHDSAVAAAAAVVCVGSAMCGSAALWLDRIARGRRPAADKLREAIEAMPEGLAFYDAEDRVVVWNRRYAELNDEGGGWLAHGASFKALLEAGLRSGVYPEAEGREADWLEERLARRRAGDFVLEQENRGHWLRIVERRTADGGVVSVCEDITELKAREASLRLMFESNPVPMWVSDRETLRFLAVNDAAMTHFGFSREEFLSRSVYDLLVPEELEPAQAALEELEDAYRAPRTWRMRNAGGDELIILPYAQMMTYEGKPALTAALFDVTLSKQAEQTMADARDQAEAASRAKTEFLANMSHEIRTPLNGVTGVAQILRQTSLSPQQAEMVRLIETSAVTLERLLSDILDLARVESGRLEINPEPFNLDAAVRATAALSELRAREKGIGFEVVIDPAAAGAVVGDEGRIKQILFNLLSNAVKFTPAGRVSLRVSVDDRLEPPRFTFVVADTGVGFQPECRDRLFSRFEQEDGSITRQFGGSGLGLAISRDLAELMGGALEADSEPGRGATFTLRLDLPWAEAAAETEWEAAPAFVSGQEPRPLRVLLAEDHPINQKVVELMLAPMGADLSCVGNGQEAVEAVAAGRFDVVLMDMQMPVMDGLTAIRLIRERERREGGPPTPIFTLSANAMSEHVEASLAAGADRHLTKPIAAPVLFGALGEIAEQVAMAEAA